jgi:Zn-dependent protease
MLRGLRIGRPFDVPLVVDWSWLLGLAAAVWITAGVWRPVTGAGAWTLSLVLGLLFLGTVIAHEVGHALVARALGIPAVDITVMLFGGMTRTTTEPDEPLDDAMIAMAGPLISVSVAGIGVLIGRVVPGQVGDLFQLLGLANLVVGAFNLLPGLPLDGGRVARALLWRATGQRLLATQVTAWIGRVLAAVVVLAGVLAALATRSPLYLVDSMIGLLLWAGAGQAERAARHTDQLRATTVADYMSRQLRSVPAWTSLADLAARGHAPEPGRGRVVVVGGDGRPLGLLAGERLAEVPAIRWPALATGSLADPVQPGHVARLDERADVFLSRYLRTPGAEYLVLDSDGRPAGIIDGPAVDRLRFVPGGGRPGSGPVRPVPGGTG